MEGKRWQENIEGKALPENIFFSMSKTGNGCTVFISQNFKKNSFRPNISKRVERDSMAGDIGGKNCS